MQKSKLLKIYYLRNLKIDCYQTRMYLQLLTLVLPLIAIIWATGVKIQTRKTFDAITMIVSGLAVISNGLIIYYLTVHGTVPRPLHIAQTLLSSTIVPLAYMYFSRQMGRSQNNATTIICWVLILFTLIPNFIIQLEGDVLHDASQIRLSSVNVVSNGKIVFSAFTADIVIFIQAMLTLIRMIPTAKTLKKYGLMLSRKMKAFFLWWILTIIFITMVSFVNTEDLTSPVGSWLYFTIYSLLGAAIYIMIALRFDLSPVQTIEDGESVKLDAFIDANKEMANKLKSMLEIGKVYLQPKYTAEDAAKDLGTNRTYFSRMMAAEFGIKFSDMINEYRIRHAMDLLANTDYTVSQVAYESGFSDASYMTRKFHQSTGLTPREFKAQNAQEK